MNCKAQLLLSACLILGACSTSTPSGKLQDTSLGEASRATLAAQVVEPEPQYETLNPATSAEHAAQAIDRYRKGTVKRPERVRSTVSTGGN